MAKVYHFQDSQAEPMAQNLTEIYNGYSGFFEKYGDPRVITWFLMKGGPMPLFIILATYLYFCLKLGPKIMAKRKPFDLKYILLFYNFVNVIGSIWLVNEGLQAGWWRDYSYWCQPVDYSNKPNALRMARAGHWYFLFKLVELLDTVFFVLRKKDNQVTGLHVYHHSFMPVFTWITAKFSPGGHTSLGAVVNTSVHVVMYSYYLLAAMGPNVQKYLWWKKYITSLQLIQFVFLTLHQAIVFFNGCDIPKFIPALCCSQTLIFMYLFGKFYVRTYSKKQKRV